MEDAVATMQSEETSPWTDAQWVHVRSLSQASEGPQLCLRAPITELADMWQARIQVCLDHYRVFMPPHLDGVQRRAVSAELQLMCKTHGRAAEIRSLERRNTIPHRNHSTSWLTHLLPAHGQH